MLTYYESGEPVLSDVAVLMLGLFFVQFIFLAIGYWNSSKQ